MRVRFEDVPLDVRRRAARAVAAIGGEWLSPTKVRKAEPQFGEATPVYRPDLPDVAYWEIEVSGAAGARPGHHGAAERRGHPLAPIGDECDVGPGTGRGSPGPDQGAAAADEWLLVAGVGSPRPRITIAQPRRTDRGLP